MPILILMGTDLIIISNHAIDYGDFDFDRLGREVAVRLNQTRLENQEFYWLSRLYWEGVAWNHALPDAQRLLVPWTFCDDDYHRAGFHDQNSWMRGQLSFNGPFEWEVNVLPGKADWSLLPFRYLGWVGPSEEDPDRPLRTAYRKALAHLVRSLGGSEVIYLADNTHVLEAFAEATDYAAMRHELQRQLGPPLPDFGQMEAYQAARRDKQTSHWQEERAYLVDNFCDLNWSQPIRLPPSLRELRDKLDPSLPNPTPPAP